jgi:hypothetical protein
MQNNNDRRSQPVVLVLALLGSLFVSSVASIYSTALLQYTQNLPVSTSLAFQIVLSQFIEFPFSITCIVWLAARSGRVGWTTWVVPLTPFICTLIYWNYFVPFSTPLIAYVCLKFLFRVSSLHLRPVEVDSSPKQLTVLSLFGLTIVVAIGMSVDLAFKAPSSIDSSQSETATTLLTAASYGIYYVSTGLVWFSAAWYWVANNPNRYFALLGLAIHLAIDFLQIAVIYPFLYDDPTFKSFYGPVYIIGTMVVDVLHVGLVFACVATMHAAGYRWDIRRRPLGHQTLG